MEEGNGQKIIALQKNKLRKKYNGPEGIKPVGCKWCSLLSVKCYADETIERYKACVEAKGYTQTYEVGYMKAPPGFSQDF